MCTAGTTVPRCRSTQNVTFPESAPKTAGTLSIHNTRLVLSEGAQASSTAHFVRPLLQQHVMYLSPFYRPLGKTSSGVSKPATDATYVTPDTSSFRAPQIVRTCYALRLSRRCCYAALGRNSSRMTQHVLLFARCKPHSLFSRDLSGRRRSWPSMVLGTTGKFESRSLLFFFQGQTILSALQRPPRTESELVWDDKVL